MKRAAIILLLAVVAVPLMLAMADLPPYGSPESPAYTHVGSYYLEHGAEEAGAENIVTDVILNYRGFDTQGEVTVIFTAMAAVLAILMATRTGAPEKRPSATPPSVVVRFIVRVMAPLALMFAVYVILNGHVTPGGGFQGGTIAGAVFIALTLVLSEQDVDRLIPYGPERVLQAAAPLTFLLIGLVGLTLFGTYLTYPRSEAGALLVTVMLVVLEIGIGVGGATVIATIFRTMGSDR